ncbi:unnamed protein product [Agarophyton chilense]
MTTPVPPVRAATTTPPLTPSSSRPPRPPRPPRQQPAPYIPPFRAKRLAAVSSPHNSQSQHWTRLKKSIHGIVNRLNASNLPHCVIDLFRLNLVRARGLFCKAVLRAQVASPNLSPVFACFVAVVGSRFPAIVNLLLRRLVAQLKSAYRNQDRASCFATARFLANLYNQHVIKDLLVLEFLCLCTVDPSDSSAELAVVILRECAPTLYQNSPDALEFVFRNLRAMLHDGRLGRRAQVAIENLLNLRRNKFRDLPHPDHRLDLLHDKDIFTHDITLEEDLGDLEYECDNFQFDRKYEENEKVYSEIKKQILGAAMDQMPPGLAEDPSRPQSDKLPNPIQQVSENNTNPNKDPAPIKTTDLSKTDLLNFRRTVYLTHSSTLSAEESAHRLFILMRENKGREAELCRMIVECCSQESSFQKVYGHLAHRICFCERSYRAHFEELFADHYATIHRFDTRKIRIIAYLFAFLLAEEAISWNILEVVRIVEEETTASSRTFLKYLFQQIRENMGQAKTKERFAKAEKDGNLKGVFPTDSAKNARFSISLFKTIGLEFLTDDLKEKLKDIPDQAVRPRDEERDTDTTSSSSLSASSSALSESSGDEQPRGNLSNDNASRGSKRPQDEAPRLESERPSKIRRLGRSASRRKEHGSRRRETRQNVELDDIERSHRAYVNSSSGSRSRRYGPEQSDDDEREYRSKRRRGQYSSYQDEERRRDRFRSSRLTSRDHREGYRSDDEAFRRPLPRDRRGRQRSDLEEYERSRRPEDRDVSPGFDGDDQDRDHHRDRRRSSKHFRAESPESRERQRRHRVYDRSLRHRYSDSDSGSPSHSPERRRRRSGWHHRRSSRRYESSDYSDEPSISRSPRHRRRH